MIYTLTIHIATLKGVSNGGRKINYIRFADDMFILADETKEIQRIIAKPGETMQEYVVNTNI